MTTGLFYDVFIFYWNRTFLLSQPLWHSTLVMIKVMKQPLPEPSDLPHPTTSRGSPTLLQPQGLSTLTGQCPPRWWLNIFTSPIDCTAFQCYQVLCLWVGVGVIYLCISFFIMCLSNSSRVWGWTQAVTHRQNLGKARGVPTSLAPWNRPQVGSAMPSQADGQLPTWPGVILTRMSQVWHDHLAQCCMISLRLGSWIFKDFWEQQTARILKTFSFSWERQGRGHTIKWWLSIEWVLRGIWTSLLES